MNYQSQIDSLWQRLKTTTSDDFAQMYVEYCSKLIELKEKDEIREEEAAYQMVSVVSSDQFTDLSKKYPECENIFDAAANTEIPREVSYTQPMGEWNQKTADDRKKEEWENLVNTIITARQRFNIK